MFVKHSWGGWARLIHVWLCVGRTPKDSPSRTIPGPLDEPRGPTYARVYTPFYHQGTGVRELVAGDNGLFVATPLTRGPARYVPVSRPVPHPSRIVYYANWTAPKAIKIPSVLYLRSYLCAKAATALLLCHLVNGAVEPSTTSSSMYSVPFFVPIPLSVSECERGPLKL